MQKIVGRKKAFKGRGTYSPDFMYVVKKSDGSKELNIIVETKDVESVSSLREDEQLKLDGYDVKFRTQLKGSKVKEIIDDVLGVAL